MKRRAGIALVVLTIASLLGLAIVSCSQPAPTTAPKPAPAPAPAPSPAPAPAPSPAAPSQQVVKWRFQGYLPVNHAVSVNIQGYFIPLAKQLSGGRLDFGSFGAGDIVAALQVLDGVSKGTFEVGYWYPGYDLGKSRAAELITNPPFGFPPAAHKQWFYQGGGRELAQEFYDTYNAYISRGIFAGPASIEAHWTKPVNSLAERKGLKIRTAGMHGEIMTKLGASVVTMAGGDLYPALQTKTIDGVEYGDPALNFSFGLHEVAKYISMPGWHEPSPAVFIIVNKAKWAELPGDLKPVFDAAVQAASEHYTAWYLQDSAIGYKKLLDYGVQVIRTSDADLATIYGMVQQIEDEQSAKDPFYGKVVKKMREFQAIQKPVDDAQFFGIKK